MICWNKCLIFTLIPLSLKPQIFKSEECLLRLDIYWLWCHQNDRTVYEALSKATILLAGMKGVCTWNIRQLYIHMHAYLLWRRIGVVQRRKRFMSLSWKLKTNMNHWANKKNQRRADPEWWLMYKSSAVLHKSEQICGRAAGPDVGLAQAQHKREFLTLASSTGTNTTAYSGECGDLSERIYRGASCPDAVCCF